MLLKRPKTHIGQPSIIPESKEEEPLRLIVIVTEGSVEELKYLKAFNNNLELKNGKKGNIIFLNDHINEDILVTEEKASHPKRRLILMKELLSLKNLEYSQYPDEAWLVCDRDEQSFSSVQYDEVLKECEMLRINLVISNPAFQLWLLFHFDAWLREFLYEDGLSNVQRLALIEKRLKCILPNYRHGDLCVSHFIHLVDLAVENSRNYCMDLLKLKNETGTNFAEIINSLYRCYSS